MDLLNSAIDSCLQLYVGMFSWAPRIVGLTVLAILVGIFMLWTVRKTSDPVRVRTAKRKVHACWLELRTYSDEPYTFLRSQNSLLRAHLFYIRLTLKPMLWIALPVTLLLIHLKAFYGRAPLTVGRDTTVTAAFLNPLDSISIKLRPPSGVQVTAPPVRLFRERELSWRVRPLRPVSDNLQFQIAGQFFTKSIEAGGPLRLIASRRVGSHMTTLWAPGEPRISVANVRWVDVRYPEARLRASGFEVNWMFWFLLVSMLVALTFRRKFGVSL